MPPCLPRRALLETRPSRYTRNTDAGWSSLVARRAHNPKVAGSNPAPATTKEAPRDRGLLLASALGEQDARGGGELDHGSQVRDVELLHGVAGFVVAGVAVVDGAVGQHSRREPCVPEGLVVGAAQADLPELYQ